ncbi:hypothetical protein RBG61_09345 [Paludicola sp. MB14-C6]|uniref:hypothetical protein n=1 Tax=Paludihabitans sp. MB14-C6 TaxID=3070656 RepID=UPI0027DBF50A|nr:hypothetical protein [Paludicola sp. MB14-C6]WMJ22201.1 hypothetical protein RBG61_09345 [Paludicola sp. MB14-C6]
MKAVFKLEWKRMKKSYGFWISLAIGVTIALLQYILMVFPAGRYIFITEQGKSILGYPTNAIQIWMGMEGGSLWGYIYAMILPLMVTIPFASTYYSDKKTGYVKNETPENFV